jgi:polyisoprenoid-binding protein YceI
MKLIQRLCAVTAIVALAGSCFAAEVYKIDPAHTSVGFSITHMVINTVHGRFGDVAGTVTVDPDASNALVEAQATIQAKSIDTGIEKRDNHLRSPDFFDVAKFPIITFVSKRVDKQGGQQMLVGDFTMHGVTQELSLPVTVKGPIKDPWGNLRLGISATGSLNRKDYGVTWNKALEAGGVMLGEEVQIQIDAEAVKPAAKP